MIVLKGSVPIAFGGTEQPAAYGEIVSIGGLNGDVNKKLSAAVAECYDISVYICDLFCRVYVTDVSTLSLQRFCFLEDNGSFTFMLLV